MRTSHLWPRWRKRAIAIALPETICHVSAVSARTCTCRTCAGIYIMSTACNWLFIKQLQTHTHTLAAANVDVNCCCCACMQIIYLTRLAHTQMRIQIQYCVASARWDYFRLGFCVESVRACVCTLCVHSVRARWLFAQRAIVRATVSHRGARVRVRD